MFEVLYSGSQIPSLTRWNVLCIVVWLISFHYLFKWTLGLISLVLFIALSSIGYAFFTKYNGILCTKIVRVREKVKSSRKAVLITGCDTGFGFNIAKRLSEKGFQVFACCLQPFQNGGKELSGYSQVYTLGMDISKEEDVTLAVDFVKQHLGENVLWAIINNAGISKGSEIGITPMETVEEVVGVNLLGTIRVTKAFLPLLQKSKGRVINVASAAGRFVMPGFLPYSVSKNGIIWFSDGLRLEMAKFGVSVVTIEPWIYRTRLSNPSSISNQIEKQWSDSQNATSKGNISNYVKKLKQHTGGLFGSLMNPNIDEVINVMEDAVTCKSPPYVYRPGKLYLNVLLWILCILPKPLSDYILCYFVFKCA